MTNENKEIPEWVGEMMKPKTIKKTRVKTITMPDDVYELLRSSGIENHSAFISELVRKALIEKAKD